MSVTIKDNSAQVRALLEENKQRALTAMGIEAVGAVKDYMEVNHIPITHIHITLTKLALPAIALIKAEHW